MNPYLIGVPAERERLSFVPIDSPAIPLPPHLRCVYMCAFLPLSLTLSPCNYVSASIIAFLFLTCFDMPVIPGGSG